MVFENLKLYPNKQMDQPFHFKPLTYSNFICYVIGELQTDTSDGKQFVKLSTTCAPE